MTILELCEKRNKAWEAAKAFVETKRDNDGLLSAEDAASYAEMEQKIKDYGAEIEHTVSIMTASQTSRNIRTLMMKPEIIFMNLLTALRKQQLPSIVRTVIPLSCIVF